MELVCVSLPSKDQPGLAGIATDLQTYLNHYAIKMWPHTDDDLTTHVVCSKGFKDAPFRTLTPQHIIISLDDASEIAQFVGIQLNQYLELSATLALVQKKALVQNPLLISEDFNHPPHERCLFNCTGQIQNYALEIESMTVCNSCREFYRCLSCEAELDQVDQIVKSVKKDSKYSEN